MSGWKINRRSCFAVSLAVVALIALPSCRKHASSTGSEQILRISQRNEPATLDPHLATLPDEFFVIRALSEGLLKPGVDEAAPQAAAAESWKISADGRTYLFQLRADAKWSNGDPVTAADFVYSIQRALSPQLAAPKASLFFALKNAAAYYRGEDIDFTAVGARALGALQLELTLSTPLPDFLALVSSGPWIPVHRATVEKFGRSDQRGSAWADAGNFVGNGRFLLTRWQPNQEIVVTPRSAERTAPGSEAEPGLKEIRFLAFDNGDSEERAFRAGQLDVTMDVPFSKIASYRGAQPAVLRHVPLYETRYLTLNTQLPPLNDGRVRRALSLAIDRLALAQKVLQGGQTPAFNFVPAGLGGYIPDQLLAKNFTEARELLAAAGYPAGLGFPKLEMTTWGSTPVLEAIQQMWQRELGIEVTVARREARTHLAALATGDYAIAMMTAIPDYNGASALFNDLLSHNPANYPHWNNAAYDQLVASASTGPRDQLLARYQQAEALLLREMPLVPLYFNAQNFLVQPRVQNWRTDRLWTRFYEAISLGN